MDFVPLQGRYPTVDRAHKYVSDAKQVAALTVIRGSKGTGKTTLAKQICEQRHRQGFRLLELDGRSLTRNTWEQLLTKIAEKNVKTLVFVDNYEHVAVNSPVVSLLENNPNLHFLVAGKDVGELDETQTALRVPVTIIDDKALMFTLHETAELLKLRLPGADALLAARIGEIAGGWISIVHVLLTRAAQKETAAFAENEATNYCLNLIRETLNESPTSLKKDLIMLTAVISEITVQQAAHILDADEQTVLSTIKKIAPNLLQQNANGTTRTYSQHPVMRRAVWQNRRELAASQTLQKWARSSADFTWLTIFVAFDTGDWARLSELISQNLSEEFIEPSPLLREQLQSIPEHAKEKYPVLQTLASIEEYAFPRGRRERVLNSFRRLATQSLNLESQKVGIRGFLASGIRLATARLSGNADVHKRMLEQVPTRLNEITSEEAKKYRVPLITACGQLALSHWHLEEYDAAEKWCRQGLNLTTEVRSVGQVHLLALRAAISAWRGDIFTAQKYVNECAEGQHGWLGENKYVSVGCVIAKALIAIEKRDFEAAEKAYEQLAWRLHTNENWPYMVWIRTHILEQKLGGAEALAWLRSEIKSHQNEFMLWAGQLRALNDLQNRLAWKYGRPQLITGEAASSGLSNVYLALMQADFRRAAAVAAAVAEEAARIGMWRLRARALLLQVVAEHELGDPGEKETRERAIALLKQYGLTSPKLERPAWWDTDDGIDATLSDTAQIRRYVGTLTRAEIRTLRAVARYGTTNRAANELHLSVHTVRDHMKSVYRKLDVRKREDAIRVAASSGLLPEISALG